MVVEKGDELLRVVPKETRALDAPSLADEGVIMSHHHTARNDRGQPSRHLLGHRQLWEWRQLVVPRFWIYGRGWLSQE